MVKKITTINLNNSRAYYGSYDPLELPNGQNLLIYGENGSGKSSLYKGLNNYFRSSVLPTTPFVKNSYQLAYDGEISIAFTDFDAAGSIIQGSSTSYSFSSLVSNNNVAFIQNTARTKGFLDYTDLLKVYLHTEPRPNLFELIVLTLLESHIPITSGGNFEFAARWKILQDELTTKTYTREGRGHKAAIRELPTFEVHLRHTLDLVFLEMNRFLQVYFSDLSMQLAYDLRPLTFNYTRWKSDWYTTADLRLNVIKDGVTIAGDYSDYLNEARLSAIAICLYLSSLLQNPTAIELKILYLDDVFIGLDAGNRLPILDILQNEFSAYQIFISTYDRHWFELAKRHFEMHSSGKWSNIEIYVGQDSIGANIITKPIVIKGETNYEKAVQYLHNRTKPDYPAAANYFRKAIEELVPKYIPAFELANEEKIQLADFKLTSLLYRAKAFIEKTKNDNSEITKIIGLLHILLHPLSHHEISSPVYKKELLILEAEFVKLENRLKAMDSTNNYQSICEISIKLKLTFTIAAATNHHCYFELNLKEPLVIQNNPGSTPFLLNSKCFTERTYGVNNGNPLAEFKPRKNDLRFNYESLEDAVNKIHIYLVGFTGVNFPAPVNYLSIIEYLDGATWTPLLNRIVWKNY
ncbi:hypothetical protein PN465_13550 [Nodularia spumigena CS-584]|nr:hypothetical protein [Nodularia spumigena CS-584]